MLQVWTENWATPTGNITINLTATPAGPVAEFSTATCGTGNKTAACTIPAPTSNPTNLQAQVAVGSNETSVSSVTLKAVVNPAGTQLKLPPTAAETVPVTAPGGTSPSSTGRSSSTAGKGTGTGTGAGNGLNGATSNFAIPPLLPDLNNAGSSLINPGSAATLFPQISPSSLPSPAPGAGAGYGHQKADPAASVSLLPLGMPVVTAQVVGLIALGLALMLTLTRLSLRRRPGGPGQNR